MDVCCECFALSGRGLCDELISRPEGSYRLWCVVVCDLEKTLKNEEAMSRVGSQRHKKNEKKNTRNRNPLTSDVCKRCHVLKAAGNGHVSELA